MPNKSRILRLQSLVTYLQSEKNGDEVFLKHNGRKIAPAGKKFYKMTADPLAVNVEIKLSRADKWVDLELWEYDVILPNSRLGTFKLLVDQHSDTFTAELIREKDSQARYVLNWELLTKVGGHKNHPTGSGKAK